MVSQKTFPSFHRDSSCRVVLTMSISVPAGAISGGELSGTEFGQRLSMQMQEQFHASPDLYDSAYTLIDFYRLAFQCSLNSD